MVSKQEHWARIKTFFRFTKQELSGLVLAVIITAFIFSFRDWGLETFDAAVGLIHLFTMVAVAALSFSFRLACQKIYALSQGYEAQFKVWWAGLLIMTIIAFISFGKLPVIIIGSIVASFMVKQRLGEFRYGFSYKDNAVISLWGIFGNLIAAVLFAVGLHLIPESYFFGKGVILNLVMAFFALLPLPQLDGLQIFFGSRGLYYLAIGLVVLAGILLLTQTIIGLIMAIIIGSGMAIVYLLIGSEK